MNLSDLADLPIELDETDVQRWICPACQEVVEHNFDLCWNCGIDREGVSDQQSLLVEDEGELADVTQDHHVSESQPVAQSCIRCGSQRIVPEAAVYDQGQGSDTKLYAMVVGNPGAMLFRDRMYGEIRADICADCGHVELHALQAEQLYQHFLRSRKQ